MIDLAEEFKALRKSLADCMCADRERLCRRLDALMRHGADTPAQGLTAIRAAIDASQARRARREQRLPRPSVAPDLPIAAYAEKITEAIRAHPVVIVVGDTGSGKTTQLPKCALAAGRGAAGLIGCTQPRRIAARSVARKLSVDLGALLGEVVGYKVRFSDETGEQTLVKVMTDGILLSEIQSDAALAAYDTLIFDEVHERSVNIDFLLGYGKLLLNRRPDLKLVVTSATLEVERLSAYFDDAPVIRIPGRTFPIELRYRPLSDREEEGDQASDVDRAVLEALHELFALGPKGDVLVFLSSEREIHALAGVLRRQAWPDVEILPLYARLSRFLQDRIFEPGRLRRVILATNIAETSLTIPRISYVVDTGLARISRYAPGRRMQRLPVEKIAQASAEQRKGRCGRLGPGVCIRLYSEEDYSRRPAFTEPELLRSNLAGVVLRMLALGVGVVESFPFLDAPEPRAVRDAFRTLRELGAVDAQQRITALGRRMARFPLDPRIGRILLAAEREHCVSEILVIASVLSTQDPRERPLERAAAADAAHRQFVNRRSDFLSLSNLWEAYHRQRTEASRRELEQWCREHFISPLRMQEWRDVYRQLHGVINELGIAINQSPAAYENVHRALLTGFLDHVACRDERGNYDGAHHKHLVLFPGSALAPKGPKWIVCAEQIQTSRLFARYAAAIDPSWLPALAGPLCQRHYGDPGWDENHGKALVTERLTLFGLPVSTGRRVGYSAVDAVAARRMFIDEGLVKGRLPGSLPFLQHNVDLLAELESWEQRLRRRDLSPTDEDLAAHYEAMLPATVHDWSGCKAWFERASADRRESLRLEVSRWLPSSQREALRLAYPDQLELGAMQLGVRYRFAPGEQDDGVSLQVPVWAIASLLPNPCERLVPGMLREKCIALIKTLPSRLRAPLVPVPSFVDACLEQVRCRDLPLTAALAEQINARTGHTLPEQSWRVQELPPNLMMRFVIIDLSGNILDSGRDLDTLRSRWSTRCREALAVLGQDYGLQRHLRTWEFGNVPAEVWIERAGSRVPIYPAFVDRGTHVDLVPYEDSVQAQLAHRAGVMRLFALSEAARFRYVRKHLPHIEAMCHAYRRLGSCDSLRDQIVEAAMAEALGEAPDTVRSAAAFAELKAQASSRWFECAVRISHALAPALELYENLYRRLFVKPAGLTEPVYAQLRAHLDRLVYGGFVRDMPCSVLGQLHRFLRALNIRLDKALRDPAQERRRAAQLEPYWERYQGLRQQLTGMAVPDEVCALRWQMEEYAVAVFAQELGAQGKVSAQRLEAALNAAEAEVANHSRRRLEM